MPELTHPAAWIFSIGAALCVGLAKTGFGGLGIVAVVLFAQVFPAKESTGALLPLLIVGDLIGVFFYRRHANWRDLLGLLPPTLAGIACGWWVMPMIPDSAFGAFLGWLILGLMAVTILQRIYPGLLQGAEKHRALGIFAGWSTGVATMLANAAGAITAFYFLARQMDKMTFVGTAAWYFLIVNLTKIPFSLHLGLISPQSLRLDLLLIPAVLAGGLLGRSLLRFVPQRAFEWITISLATAAALRLIALS